MTDVYDRLIKKAPECQDALERKLKRGGSSVLVEHKEVVSAFPKNVENQNFFDEGVIDTKWLANWAESKGYKKPKFEPVSKDDRRPPVRFTKK
jgi:hypothetical protein